MDVKFQHLLGRPFEHGKWDCYALGRDFYRDNYEIDLPNVARPDDWWDKGYNLYEGMFQELGFVKIDLDRHKLRVGDVFLCAMHAPVANHCAVYIGGNDVIHHMRNRLSERRRYNFLLKKSTRMVIRHPDVPFDPTPRETFNFLDHVLPHHREKLETAIGRPLSETQTG